MKDSREDYIEAFRVMIESTQRAIDAVHELRRRISDEELSFFVPCFRGVGNRQGKRGIECVIFYVHMDIPLGVGF
jgi:hypothetical protein